MSDFKGKDAKLKINEQVIGGFQQEYEPRAFWDTDTLRPNVLLPPPDTTGGVIQKVWTTTGTGGIIPANILDGNTDNYNVLHMNDASMLIDGKSVLLSDFIKTMNQLKKDYEDNILIGQTAEIQDLKAEVEELKKMLREVMINK